MNNLITDSNEDFKQNFKKAKEKIIKYKDKIFYDSFVTIEDYLEKFELITKLLSVFKQNSIIMIAAAVSDYFIPKNKMSSHKIQSTGDNLIIELYQVKKQL